MPIPVSKLCDNVLNNDASRILQLGQALNSDQCLQLGIIDDQYKTIEDAEAQIQAFAKKNARLGASKYAMKTMKQRM